MRALAKRCGSRHKLDPRFRLVVDHLTWRRGIGKRVCLSYASASNVLATALGGSVARGWADEFSDIEVFVFWDEPPSDAQRLSAVEGSGGRIDVYWSEHNAEEQWQRAIRATDGRVGQLWPYEDQEWSEHYFINGVNIGVSGFLASTVDAWIGGLNRGVLNDNAEMVASTLLTATPITGEARLGQWASNLQPYPEALALAVVEKCLQVDEQWWSIDQLAARDDRPAFDSALVAMQQRLIRLLLVANRRYLEDPRPKWTRKLIAGFEHRPDDCMKRLDAVQTSPPVEAARQLQDLFEDTLNLLDELLPSIDVESALWLFQQRRPAFTNAPPTDNSSHDSPEPSPRT